MKINKSEYLRKKQERESFSPPRRILCLDCLRPTKACFCSSLEPFDTETKFIFLMHPKEAKKESLGTGRLTHLSLKNSELIVGENFKDDKKVNSYIRDDQFFSMLLYPGDDAHNISKERIETKGAKLLIFIIDGTWPCAKSMMRESPNLHTLPRLSFDNKHISRFKIKHQPAKYCLSTIESLYYLLSDLEKNLREKLNNCHEQLLKTLDTIVDFQLKCAADPTLKKYRRGSYKDPSQRVDSKKWESRKICFDDKNY